jgi:hypothetical protein
MTLDAVIQLLDKLDMAILPGPMNRRSQIYYKVHDSLYESIDVKSDCNIMFKS